MATKILVVEDQFIEANDLKIILEEAGHHVSGIAKSYDHARLFLERERPDIVLLDIFLKGKLTGLDLAAVLNSDNIPFIYLSANSNPSVLDAAKLTKPYGFLVKPFRSRDVLVALNIAGYRHEHQTNLIKKQEQLLTTILSSILGDDSNAKNKLLRVAQAFKPYIPFDVLSIDVNNNSPDLQSLFVLRRMGFNQYKTHSGLQLAADLDFNHDHFRAMRIKSTLIKNIKLENSDDFKRSVQNDPFLQKLINDCGVKSRIVVPLGTSSGIQMSMRFYSFEPEIYSTEHLELLTPLKAILSMVLENIGKKAGGANINEPKPGPDIKPPQIDGIIGNSPKLLRALDQVSQVANFDMSVLILGETGTGKEGLVKAIHNLSSRKKRPLIKINCGAIPSQLIESELFGHEKGAFTGAYERRIGKFEQAQGGTIFLDEVGELPLETQTKLLRVLQERELERVGGRSTIKVDVRVIAATNRNLHKDVAEGNFRMDLFYRLNAFPIYLAPLRERKEDILLLSDYFLEQQAIKTGSEIKQLSQRAKEQLLSYSFPGNVRELLHLIERSVVLTIDNVIGAVELDKQAYVSEIPDELPLQNFQTIDEVDKAHIIAALKVCNGKISGKGGAAEMLKLPATTLNSKMKKLGISWKFIY